MNEEGRKAPTMTLHTRTKKAMTQEERWILKYNEVVEFIETNHRNPSRHRIEEHDMLSWIKQQRKLIKAGSFKSDRMEKFMKMERLFEENKRLNQYQ